MPSGPLPQSQRRRRNAPIIPTSVLPAEGRQGPAPRLPNAYKLGTAGKSWWKWAWSTPQAAGWDDGSLFALARRASLEDDLIAVAIFDEFSLADYLDIEDSDASQRLNDILKCLKALAGGRVVILKEMDALDIQFGLTAKGREQLRWVIKGADGAPDAEADGVSEPTPKWSKLRAVDSA